MNKSAAMEYLFHPVDNEGIGGATWEPPGDSHPMSTADGNRAAGTARHRCRAVDRWSGDIIAQQETCSDQEISPPCNLSGINGYRRAESCLGYWERRITFSLPRVSRAHDPTT
jgi:hypothetical protein